jgi:hypothetical protein
MKEKNKQEKSGFSGTNFLMFHHLNELYTIPGSGAHANRHGLWKYPPEFFTPPFLYFHGYALLPGRLTQRKGTKIQSFMLPL